MKLLKYSKIHIPNKGDTAIFAENKDSYHIIYIDRIEQEPIVNQRFSFGNMDSLMIHYTTLEVKGMPHTIGEKDRLWLTTVMDRYHKLIIVNFNKVWRELND